MASADRRDDEGLLWGTARPQSLRAQRRQKGGCVERGPCPPLLCALLAALDTADEKARREIASRLGPYLVDHPSQLLNARQKAEQLGLHPETLVRMARGGRIPAATKVGREWRFPAGACQVLPPSGSALAPQPAPRARRIVSPLGSVAAIRGR